MMESVADIVAKILDEAREAIQVNMATRHNTPSGVRWVNASGRSSAAFQVQRYERGVRLVYEGDDVAPLDTIQEGQDGSDPPSVAELQRWWREKFDSELEERRAEAMVRRIMAEGTERWRDPQYWIINPVVSEAVERIEGEVSGAYVKEVINDLDKVLK